MGFLFSSFNGVRYHHCETWNSKLVDNINCTIVTASVLIPRVTMRSYYDITNLMYGAQTAAEFDFYQGEPEPLLLDTVMQHR